jgi:pilus assembly protein CpaB
MKKNVVPLLAIAFLVAAISTGVFYGLFASRLGASSPDLPQHSLVVAAHDLERGTVLKREDLRIAEIRLKTPLKGSFDSPDKLVGATLLDPLQENEPLTTSRLALKDSSSGGGNGVPSGMRAISVHVYESTGIVGLLRHGSKVDIQAVAERNGSFALSTVLQDVEVLSVSAAAEQGLGRPSAAIVTVLTRPADSDIVALADSGTHLRVALRNPLDNRTEPRKALSVPDLYRASDTTRRAPPKAQNSAAGAPLHASRLSPQPGLSREPSLSRQPVSDPPTPAGRLDGAAGRGR